MSEINPISLGDGRAVNPYDEKRAENAIRELLSALGEDPDRDCLK